MKGEGLILSEELKLDTLVQRISFLNDKIPETRHDQLLLVLSYWKIFDEIPIPDWLIQDISQKASKPDSILRIGRKVSTVQQLQSLIRSLDAEEEN